MSAETDRRIAYGAVCVWWGSIYQVGTLGNGLPCCPTCRGLLFEVENEEVWLEGARRHEVDGHPGYVAFVQWLRGRCFKTMEDARRAYDESRRPGGSDDET